MTKKNQVQRMLLGLMKTGMLNIGDKLPSLREISVEHGVSISTALDAYNDLVSYDVVESRPKNGYFVISTDDALLDNTMKKLAVDAFPNVSRIDYMADEAQYMKYAANTILPFSHNCVQLASDSISMKYFNADLHNHRTLKKDTKNSLDSLQHKLNETSAELALEISKLVYPLDCLLQRKLIVITTSITEAIMLAMRVCCVPGSTIGVESPGHNGFYRAAKFLNMNCVEIDSDPIHGLSLTALKDRINQGVKLSCLLLMTHNSNPTGAVMPKENRAELLRICRDNAIPIIENDDMNWLAFSSIPHNPLKSLDHANVIYISGFQNLFGDDYGLAWIEGGKFAERLSYIKGLSGIKTPYAAQEHVADILASHSVDTYISGLNQSVRETVLSFYHVLSELLPKSIKITEPHSGPFLWVELPAGMSADDFSDYAATHRVYVSPGSLFSSLEKPNRCFRINCCTSGKRESAGWAAKALAEVLIKYLK